MGDIYMEAVAEVQRMRARLEALESTPVTRALIFDVETPDENQQIFVDKKYYRIDFINETESGVEIHISRKSV